MTKISTDKKILVIVESPNKVSTISKILKDLGYTNAVVMASVGHTTKIKDNRKSYRNTGIYPEENFKVDWAIDPDKKSVVDRLKAQAKKADLVLIASDPDREGESLGNHIKQLLQLNDSQYYRIKYHSVTKDDIKKALENPSYMNQALCEAAESRQVVDKMIGYTLSPVAKSYLGARSVGRCQSAGLKLIADREREIRDFVPEHFYDLYLNFWKDGIEYKAKYIGNTEKLIEKISSTDQLLDIKANCYLDYVVTDIQKKRKKEGAKPPFCTATFQQEAASKLGLKVKDAMSCAQKLFEGISIEGEHVGLITYMRTDATDLAADFLPLLESYITETYGPEIYQKPKAGPKAKNAQEGHEALRVVDPKLTPELLAKHIKNELLVKVYRLIWQRTIAAAFPDAIFDETNYLITNNNQVFKYSMNLLAVPGYKIVYGDPEIIASKTLFKKQEVLENCALQEIAKQTQPPARYKEATLIKELQKQGIGRPSTYVTIVETVLSPTRGYCTLDDKEIVPTEKGIQLASFLDRAFSDIISLDYTKKLEESLDAIANEKLNRVKFLTDFHQKLETAVTSNTETAGSTLQLGEQLCPNCNSPMVVRRSRYGKLFYGCSQYPVCRGIVGID